jgi:hypothetical protein
LYPRILHNKHRSVYRRFQYSFIQTVLGNSQLRAILSHDLRGGPVNNQEHSERDEGEDMESFPELDLIGLALFSTDCKDRLREVAGFMASLRLGLLEDLNDVGHPAALEYHSAQLAPHAGLFARGIGIARGILYGRQSHTNIIPNMTAPGLEPVGASSGARLATYTTAFYTVALLAAFCVCAGISFGIMKE